MRHVRTLSLLLVASVALLVALPALAVGNGSDGGALQNLLSDQWSTAGIVAICSAVAAVALACSNLLPGWATKANTVVIVATAMGTAIEKLGPTAGAFAIILAAVGVLIGYTRSETRAAAAAAKSAG